MCFAHLFQESTLCNLLIGPFCSILFVKHYACPAKIICDVPRPQIEYCFIYLRLQANNMLTSGCLQLWNVFIRFRWFAALHLNNILILSAGCIRHNAIQFHEIWFNFLRCSFVVDFCFKCLQFPQHFIVNVCQRCYQAWTQCRSGEHCS